MIDFFYKLISTNNFYDNLQYCIYLVSHHCILGESQCSKKKKKTKINSTQANI